MTDITDARIDTALIARASRLTILGAVCMDVKIVWPDKKKLGQKMELAEIGPRFVLQPIRVFSQSFHGATLFDNPHYISPNHVCAHGSLFAPCAANQSSTNQSSISTHTDSELSVNVAGSSCTTTRNDGQIRTARDREEGRTGAQEDT
jgi:hypothetical protein